MLRSGLLSYAFQLFPDFHPWTIVAVASWLRNDCFWRSIGSKNLVRLSLVAFLIRAGGAICGHYPGIGRRPVCDGFGRGAGVGCPGRVGTGRLFAGGRISWTRLIFRGVVAAAGKKHQGDQWYDSFHNFWSIRLVDTKPSRSLVLIQAVG